MKKTIRDYAGIIIILGILILTLLFLEVVSAVARISRAHCTDTVLRAAKDSKIDGTTAEVLARNVCNVEKE